MHDPTVTESEDVDGVSRLCGVEQLLMIARKRGPETHLMVLLGGDAGLRLGEIVALEWNDVDLRARRLTVQRSDWRGHVTVPKGGRTRQVPTTQRLTIALKAFRHLRSDRAFCLPDGAPITRDRVIKAIRGAQRLAGLRQSGVHLLRHTFCSHLAMKSAPARAIQELADWPRGLVDDATLHASQPRGDPVVGRTHWRPPNLRKFWRHFGDGISDRRK